MRILGIDPGSTATGFGVVETSARNRLVHVSHGTLRTRSVHPMAARLASLYADLCDVIALHQPDLAAVERVFVAASPRSALVLGQARGAILAAAGGRGLGVSEYTPSQVKHAVVGTGSAAKAQVQSMVQRLLGLSHRPARDAADALAVAICHAHAAHLTSMGVVSRARRGPRRRSGSFVVRRVR